MVKNSGSKQSKKMSNTENQGGVREIKCFICECIYVIS